MLDSSMKGSMRVGFLNILGLNRALCGAADAKKGGEVNVPMKIAATETGV